MRTFVALNLPTVQRERIHQSLDGLRARALPLRWTSAEALHLTLKFLGDIDGSEIPRIEQALRDVGREHPPVPLRTVGLGAFPSLRRTSVLWVGVHPDEQLLLMQAELELAFSRLGYARESRPFRPHITIARARRDARAPDLERYIASTAVIEEETVVASLDFMRSHTAPDGARYEVLLRAPLAAPEAVA
jgi:RNA 2',3'-cyclic 3'-phosphodiesterase